jgi:hypothetical protein
MKKKVTNIFASAKKRVPTEEEAERDALHYLQTYLDIIKNDESKVEDFKAIVNELFNNIHK